MGDLDISSEINSCFFLTVDLKKEVTLLKNFISSFLGFEWECFLKNEHSGTTAVVNPVAETIEPSGTTAVVIPVAETLEPLGTTAVGCSGVDESLEPSGTTAFGVGETLTQPDPVDLVAIIEDADEDVKPLNLKPPLKNPKNLKRDLAVERTNILNTKRRN